MFRLTFGLPAPGGARERRKREFVYFAEKREGLNRRSDPPADDGEDAWAGFDGFKGESGKRLIVDTSWRAKKPCVRFTCPLYFSFVSGVLWIHPDAWKRGHERFTPQGTYRAIASTRIAGLAGVRLE